MPSATESSHPEGLPIVDFSAFDKNPSAIAVKLFVAAQRWGFLVLTGHGIPREQIDAMFITSSAFFDQPKDVKSEKWMNIKQQGYDYKESLIGVVEGMCFGSVADANLTCDNIPSWWTFEKRQQAEAFRATCNALTQKLMHAFAMAMGLEPTFFSSAHTPHKDPGNVLRLIRYPALDKAVDPSFPRLGEHTDWGTLTLLFAKTPGLEVRSPDDKRWVAAPVVEEGIIVNVADGLALWTGELLKSTQHRLSWDSLPANHSRDSMAYFVNADADAPLKALKRDPDSGKYVEAALPFDATFGDYQNARMRIINEKFDSDGTADELKIDPRFMDIVRSIGVAHGTGINFEGAHDTAVAT